MKVTVPKTATTLTALLRADMTTQWRNRKALMMVVLVPVIILISWKGLIAQLGGAFILSTCITLGLISNGLMGYSNSVARDREKGVFQRLRVAPLPNWCIMGSRLIIQLMIIVGLTIIIFIAGKEFDDITLKPIGYILALVCAIAGGSVYLGLGQAIVGRIKNPETVNSTVRLVYFLFIMIGMFGDLGMLGDQLKEVVHYSPYGAVKTIVAMSMEPSKWTTDTTLLLGLTFGYSLVFCTLGIKWFKWK